jgi:hypothetical protein
MPISISINKSNNKNALIGWEILEVHNYTTLAMLMKKYSYSASVFNKRRNSSNVNTFHNLLIYDIDNDPTNPYLSISIYI